MKQLDRSNLLLNNILMMTKNSDAPAINKMNLIFDLLASKHKSLSQISICTQLDLPKATVSRLINTLPQYGLFGAGEQKWNVFFRG